VVNWHDVGVLSKKNFMDIIIQSLGFKASEELEDFVREKINGLKHDKIVRANVALFKGPDSEPENSYCEIRLEIPGNDPFVKKQSPYFESAVSECIDVLEQVLRDLKTKQQLRRKGDATAIQDAVMQAEEDLDLDPDPDLEDVVK
jgi:ribosome-associated translation inhibitor RaiA